MNRVKILEIGPYLPPRTGWSVRIAHVQRALWQYGHECVPLNLGPERQVPSSDYEDVQSGWDYIRKVQRYCQHGYLLHMHANGESPKGFILTFLALLIGWGSGRRAVLTYHGGPEQRYVSRTTGGGMRAVLRLVFRLPQRIICNNDAVKTQLISCGAPGSRVVTIPAFSTQYLETTAPELSEPLQHFINTRVPLLFTYLMCREEFDVVSVLEAVAMLAKRWPNLGMIVTGAGEAAEDMQELIHAARVEEHVYHAGDVAHETFLYLLQQSKLYVRSHALDGICASVMEALSLGVPVVASEDGLRPESVITFALGDAADMAHKVTEVLEQYDTIKRQVVRPVVTDTVEDEVQLLVGCCHT